MNQQQFMALPEDQRIAAQKRLIDLGLYNGKADGKWGAGTKAAFEQEAKRAEGDAKASREAEERKRQDDLKAKELDIEAIKAQGNKAASDAATEAQKAETARKQRYQDQASSGIGMATQSSANIVAPAAGTGLGMALGRGVNAAMDASQSSKNKVLAAAAQDRLAGITTRDGAREGARLSGAMPINNTVGRTMSRMAPHLGLGALSMGKGAQILSESDPNGEFYPQMADRAAGLGYIGTGAGLAKQGLRYAFSPGVAPDAQAIALINSNQLRRNGAPGALAQALSGETVAPDAPQPRPALTAPDAPEAPVKAPSHPGSKAYMRDQAEALGLKGYKSLNKTELATALSEAMAEKATKRVRAPKIPGGGAGGAAALAGGLAYALTPDRAEAATGAPTGNQAQALTNAGIAGGTAYGTSKLADALSPVVGKAIGMAGEASAPGLIDSMTDPTPAEMNTAANWQIQNLPEWMLSPNVRQMAQMSELPSRGDRSDPSMLARAQAEQAERMPMASASALEIPEGIPAPQADGSSPYGQGIDRRLRRMIATGATPEQLSSFLNQAVR